LAPTKTHKYAKASCTVLTALDTEMIAHLCDEAAAQAESVQFKIHRADNGSNALHYIVKTRIGGVGKAGEKMEILVSVSDTNGQTSVKTSIARYTLQRSWPFPWQMLAWGNYKKFMNTLTLLIKSKDAGCTSKIVEMA
jgi:hypothetical protein